MGLNVMLGGTSAAEAFRSHN